MTVIRKRQTINSGEKVQLEFDFSETLGSGIINEDSRPAGTLKIVEGIPGRRPHTGVEDDQGHLILIDLIQGSTPPLYEMPSSDFTVEYQDAAQYKDRGQAHEGLSEDEWKRLGRVALLDFRAPANAQHQIWDVEVSIMSGSFAYSTATRVVGS